MSPLEQRLTEIMFHLKIQDYVGFAEYLGIDANRLYYIRKGKSKNIDDILQVLRKSGINPEWVKTGKGDMLISQPQEEPRHDVVQREVTPELLNILGLNSKIPIYLVPVSAGAPMPIDEAIIDRYLDPQKFLSQDRFIIEVRGDSMELADIVSGDWLLVDRVIPPTEDDIVVAYVNGGMTVKTVKKVNGTILLNPANPDYEPIEITDNTTLMGKVIFKIRPQGKYKGNL